MTEDKELNVNKIRDLNLTWGENFRDGAFHKEWQAPCGCAYHPEPKPHAHQCARHANEDSRGENRK